MSNQNAKIDDNRKKTLLGVTNDSNAEYRRLLVDATTGRLLVSAIISGLGTITETEDDTTDATPTAITSISATEDYAYLVDARIIARQSDGSNRGVWHLQGLFYRNSGGNITQQGLTNSLTTIRSNTNWDADLVVNTSSQEIEVQCTGVAGTTITWQVNLTYYSLT